MLSCYSEYQNWKCTINENPIARFSVSFENVQKDPAFKGVSLNIYVDDAARLSLKLPDEEMLFYLASHLKKHGYPPPSPLQKKMLSYWINISHLAYLEQFLNDLSHMDKAINEVMVDIVYAASKHIQNKSPITGWVKEGDFRLREMNWPKKLVEAEQTPLIRAAYYINSDPNGKFRQINLLGYRDRSIRLWAEVNSEYEKELMEFFKKIGIIKITNMPIEDEQTLTNYLTWFNQQDPNVANLMKDMLAEYRNRNKMNAPLPFTVFLPVKGVDTLKKLESKLQR